MLRPDPDVPTDPLPEGRLLHLLCPAPRGSCGCRHPPSRGGGFSPTGTALACKLGSCSHLGIVDADKAHG